MSDYMPTTDEVREWYSESDWSIVPSDARASFDRWLASVKAEALRQAAYALNLSPPADTRDPLEAEVRQIKMLRARADEMEADS